MFYQSLSPHSLGFWAQKSKTTFQRRARSVHKWSGRATGLEIWGHQGLKEVSMRLNFLCSLLGAQGSKWAESLWLWVVRFPFQLSSQLSDLLSRLRCLFIQRACVSCPYPGSWDYFSVLNFLPSSFILSLSLSFLSPSLPPSISPSLIDFFLT